MLSPFFILIAIAIILTVLSFIWSGYPFLNVAVLLLAVALLVGR